MTDASAVLEWHLRRLSPAGCAALVRDLWAARGFETRRTDDAIVATDASRRRVIRVYRESGRSTGPDRRVDVVVAPGGAAGARTLADRAGADLVDAAELRRLLTYAVDRETAATLCARHLGAPPSELRPPLRWRVRDRIAALEVPDVPAGVRAATVALLAVALLAGLVVTGGSDPASRDAAGAGLSIVGGGDADASSADTSPEDPVTGPVAAPGLNASGVTNLSALATAHERALANRSYSLWVDWYWTRGANETQRDVDFAVAGSRYLLRSEHRQNGVGQPLRTVYYDGNTSFVATFDGGNVSYHRIAGSGTVGPSPHAFARTLVRDWLATPETTVVDRVVEEGRLVYEVVGRGSPTAIASDTVANYTVVAYVDGDGLVRHAEVQYITFLTGRTVRIRFEWTYGRIGATEVEPPSYYDELIAGNTTDGTASDRPDG